MKIFYKLIIITILITTGYYVSGIHRPSDPLMPEQGQKDVHLSQESSESSKTAGPNQVKPTLAVTEESSYEEQEVWDFLPTLEPLKITPTVIPTARQLPNIQSTPTPQLPALQALDIVQRSNVDPKDLPANSRVGFLTGNSRRNTEAQPAASATTAPNTASNELPLVSGQARGYAMLYMMHPRARKVVEAQVETLIKANIVEVYIGVLVDGTFGKDHPYLRSVLQRLNDAGRIITLEQYLVSGPTMRRAGKTPIVTPFSIIKPDEFRYLMYEENTDREIRKVAREAKETFLFNTSLNKGNTNLVSVMLEDNLDSPSYRYMRNIVSQEIGNTADFIRNACPRCYTGNDKETFGDALELHKVSEFPELGQGDGYTLDGVDVMYPFDQELGKLPVEDLKSMLQEAFTKRLAFFGLWRKKSQGLGGATQLQHPDKRNYIPPTEEEKQMEIELLREGLLPAN